MKRTDINLETITYHTDLPNIGYLMALKNLTILTRLDRTGYLFLETHYNFRGTCLEHLEIMLSIFEQNNDFESCIVVRDFINKQGNKDLLDSSYTMDVNRRKMWDNHTSKLD